MISNSKTCLILALADPSGNPRPKRAFELVYSMGFHVDIASYKIRGNLTPRNHFEIPVNKECFVHRSLVALFFLLVNFTSQKVLLEKIVSFRCQLGNINKKLSAETYDLIIVEDLFLLPLALKHKKKAKVIFDAREYYTRQREHSIIFNVIEKPIRIHICNQYLKLCDKILTVSTGLSDEYKREFEIDTQIIMSTPNYMDKLYPIHPKNDKIKMVHHGGAKENRNIENMIDILSFLDERFSLDFYLTGNPNYIKHLKQYARKCSNIKFYKPVDFASIIPMLNKYDIGLYFLKPTGFNTKYCLPNKIFEFIQARLMVAIGPSPDMARVVKQYSCGIVSNSFDVIEMSKKLQYVNAKTIMYYKKNSDMAARKLNWESEGQKLKNTISSLFFSI